MAIQKFEDMIAWQRAQDLAVAILEILKQVPDRSFKDQMWRATVSVSNNLAEGFDRSSNADFKRFAFMAIGSCSEVKSMLYLSQRTKLLDGLIKSLDNPKS